MVGITSVGSVSSLDSVHNHTPHTEEAQKEGETSEHVHGSGVGNGQNNNDTPIENEERRRQPKYHLNGNNATRNLLNSRYTGGKPPTPPNGPSDETIVTNVDPADGTMHVTVPNEMSNQELQRLIADTIQHIFAAHNQSFNEMVQHMTVPQFNI